MSNKHNTKESIRVGLCGFSYGHQTNYGACLLREAGVIGVGACPPPQATSSEVSDARRNAEQLGLAFFESLESLLENAKPDFVSLAIHPAHNPEAIEAVASRGVAILSEKPIAYDEAGLERVRRAIETHGVFFALAVAAATHARPVAQALEQFENGAIGSPRVAFYQFLQSKGPNYTTPANSPNPIGEIDIFGPYAFIFLNKIFGDQPRRIHAAKANFFYPWYRDLGVSDLGVVHVEYPSSGVASIVLGRTTTKSIPNTDGRIEIIGDSGVLHIDCLNFHRIVGYHQENHSDTGFHWHETDSNFTQFYVRDVLNAYRTGELPPVSFQEAYTSQQCVFSVTQ